MHGDCQSVLTHVIKLQRTSMPKPQNSQKDGAVGVRAHIFRARSHIDENIIIEDSTGDGIHRRAPVSSICDRGHAFVRIREFLYGQPAYILLLRRFDGSSLLGRARVSLRGTSSDLVPCLLTDRRRSVLKGLPVRVVPAHPDSEAVTTDMLTRQGVRAPIHFADKWPRKARGSNLSPLRPQFAASRPHMCSDTPPCPIRYRPSQPYRRARSTLS